VLIEAFVPFKERTGSTVGDVVRSFEAIFIR
jgi:hypothetical protein